jgi:hypothetical protein
VNDLKEKGYELVEILVEGDYLTTARVIHRWCHICKKSTKQYAYQESRFREAHKCSECNVIQKVSIPGFSICDKISDEE